MRNQRQSSLSDPDNLLCHAAVRELLFGNEHTGQPDILMISTAASQIRSCYNVPMPRMVKCAKLGRELPGLDEPPFDTELGQKIYENVSAEAWKMWAEHSKMLLNEYRLQPWKPEAQQFLVEQMQQYFFGQGAQLPKEFVPPPK